MTSLSIYHYTDCNIQNKLIYYSLKRDSLIVDCVDILVLYKIIIYNLSKITAFSS